MNVAGADGSSLSNRGPARRARCTGNEAWVAGGWKHGTNDMDEFMVVLDLLCSTVHVNEKRKVLCDSQYAINSLTMWMPGLKRRGWKEGDGKPVTQC